MLAMLSVGVGGAGKQRVAGASQHLFDFFPHLILEVGNHDVSGMAAQAEMIAERGGARFRRRT